MPRRLVTMLGALLVASALASFIGIIHSFDRHAVTRSWGPTPPPWPAAGPVARALGADALRVGHVVLVSACGTSGRIPALMLSVGVGSRTVGDAPFVRDEGRAGRCVEARWTVPRAQTYAFAISSSVPVPSVAVDRVTYRVSLRPWPLGFVPVALLLAGFLLLILAPRSVLAVDEPADDAGPRFVDRPLALLWIVLAWFAVQGLVIEAGRWMMPLSGDGTRSLERGTPFALLLLLQHGAMAIVAVACLRWNSRRGWRDSVGLLPVDWKGIARAGVAAGFLVVLALLSVRLIHDVGKSPLGRLMEIPSARYAIAFGALVAPLSEELFFRGLLVPALMRWGAAAAIAGSTLLFTLVHAMQLQGALVGLIPIASVSAVNGWLRVRSGGITEPWIVHTIYNFVLMASLFAN